MRSVKGTPTLTSNQLKLHLVSLGCAKNQVDSEIMLGRLAQAGWTITEDPEEAHTIVVNTCSFIEDAAQESIDMILELAEYKKNGICRRLVVAGCLHERYREEILQTMPEVDVFLGTGAFDQIVTAVGDLRIVHEAILPDPDRVLYHGLDSPRMLSTPHMAYLKVAEGCSRGCCAAATRAGPWRMWSRRRGSWSPPGSGS